MWVTAEWQNLDSKDHLHLIEYGPGRGTLAADMLRVSDIISNISTLMLIFKSNVGCFKLVYMDCFCLVKIGFQWCYLDDAAISGAEF